MEAPEKIYVTEGMIFMTNPEITLSGDNKIEYTRTDALKVKEVDLNAAIERYVEQHKSELNGYFDIRRIAKHFFELGLLANAEMNMPINNQGATPVTISNPHPEKLAAVQGDLSRPSYKNGGFYHQNFISDKEFLDRAIDFIVDREEENDYICEQLHNIPEEFKLCAKDCQNLDHWCILRFLKHYRIKHLYESKS